MVDEKYPRGWDYAAILASNFVCGLLFRLLFVFGLVGLFAFQNLRHCVAYSHG